MLTTTAFNAAQPANANYSSIQRPQLANAAYSKNFKTILGEWRTLRSDARRALLTLAIRVQMLLNTDNVKNKP